MPQFVKAKHCGFEFPYDLCVAGLLAKATSLSSARKLVAAVSHAPSSPKGVFQTETTRLWWKRPSWVRQVLTHSSHGPLTIRSASLAIASLMKPFTLAKGSSPFLMHGGDTRDATKCSLFAKSLIFITEYKIATFFSDGILQAPHVSNGRTLASLGTLNSPKIIYKYDVCPTTSSLSSIQHHCALPSSAL